LVPDASLGQSAAPEKPACVRQKRFVPVAAEITANNVLLYGYHRFLTNGWNYKNGWGWGESWSRAFTQGPDWDGNAFGVNQFTHPYHGGLYFNSARSHGYNYWESMPFTAAGSFMWEFFGEASRPSMNDLINTTVGGFAVGEATYRLSNYMFQAHGKTPFTAAAALLFNPIGGLHGLLSSDTHGAGCDVLPSRMQGFFSVGYQHVVGDKRNHSSQIAFDFSFRYGDPFRGDYRSPFASFEIGGQLRSGYWQPLGQFRVRGLLYGKPIGDRPTPHHIFGISQHLDFVDDEAFEFGGQSFSAGLLSRAELTGGLELRTSADALGVLLGAVHSEYAAITGGNARTYDYGPGLGLKTRASLEHEIGLQLSAGYSGFWIHSIAGAKAHHWVHILSTRLLVPVPGSLGATFEYVLHGRDSHFREYANVQHWMPQFRMYVTVRSG
jgi:hypothetical protein